MIRSSGLGSRASESYHRGVRSGPGILICAFGVFCGCTSGPSTVVISEFLATNNGGLRDADGDTSDWIELHNHGQAAVDLEGWCLTDRPGQARWCFPAIAIQPQAFLVVFASGKQVANQTPPLHATFKLAASSDYLALLRPNGTTAAEFAPYPDQRSDTSFGLTSKGTPTYLAQPTPGAPNVDPAP